MDEFLHYTSSLNIVEQERNRFQEQQNYSNLYQILFFPKCRNTGPLQHHIVKGLYLFNG